MAPKRKQAYFPQHVSDLVAGTPKRKKPNRKSNKDSVKNVNQPASIASLPHHLLHAIDNRLTPVNSASFRLGLWKLLHRRKSNGSLERALNDPRYRQLLDAGEGNSNDENNLGRAYGSDSRRIYTKNRERKRHYNVPNHHNQTVSSGSRLMNDLLALATNYTVRNLPEAVLVGGVQQANARILRLLASGYKPPQNHVEQWLSRAWPIYKASGQLPRYKATASELVKHMKPRQVSHVSHVSHKASYNADLPLRNADNLNFLQGLGVQIGHANALRRDAHIGLLNTYLNLTNQDADKVMNRLLLRLDHATLTPQEVASFLKVMERGVHDLNLPATMMDVVLKVLTRFDLSKVEDNTVSRIIYMARKWQRADVMRALVNSGVSLPVHDLEFVEGQVGLPWLLNHVNPNTPAARTLLKRASLTAIDAHGNPIPNVRNDVSLIRAAIGLVRRMPPFPEFAKRHKLLARNRAYMSSALYMLLRWAMARDEQLLAALLDKGAWMATDRNGNILLSKHMGRYPETSQYRSNLENKMGKSVVMWRMPWTYTSNSG